MKVKMDAYFSCYQEGNDYFNVYFVDEENRPVRFKVKTEETKADVRKLKMGDLCTLKLNYYDFKNESGAFHGFTLDSILKY